MEAASGQYQLSMALDWIVKRSYEALPFIHSFSIAVRRNRQKVAAIEKHLKGNPKETCLARTRLQKLYLLSKWTFQGSPKHSSVQSTT
jgi:hypothetical protein